MVKLTIRYSKKRVRNSGATQAEETSALESAPNGVSHGAYKGRNAIPPTAPPECKTHSRRERPQAKTVGLSEYEPISIFDIKERFVPEGYDLDHLPDTEFLSDSAKPILKLLKLNAHAVELPVWHPDGYAGTLDLYAQWDDQPTIIDFMTSKRWQRIEWVKKKFLQTTAYAIAHNWLFETAIKNIAVIVLSPDKCQIFEDEISTYQQEWETQFNQFLGFSKETELSSDRANCNRSSSVK